jgi:hypothetical protein
MWCTPYFSSNFNSPHYTVPPSSSPFEIYNRLRDEINGADQHGTKIELNRLGICKGARAMKERSIISETQMNEIFLISEKAAITQFRPLLCVIARKEALPYYHRVDIGSRANPLAHEYIVADLPQSAFDVISIG